MFDAIVNQRIDLEGLEFSVRMADVEALNKAAFAGEADVTKLSYHAYAHCTGDYVLLDAGSALGRNCGPLLISKRDDREGRRRGREGSGSPSPGNTRPRISCSVWRFPRRRTRRSSCSRRSSRRCWTRSTTPGSSSTRTASPTKRKGLKKIIDLGEFWEGETGAPIPLGGIVINRSLPDEVKRAVNRVLRRSVEYAFAHRAASLPFVREHAQEMSEDVMYRHIDLYVNEYSVDLGAEGRRAVELLFERARAAGIIPARAGGDAALFLTPSAAGP